MLNKLFSKLGNFIGFQSKENPQQVQINLTGNPKVDIKRIERRKRCLRNETVFGAKRGTKAHRRFYYLYNPGYFTAK